MMMMMMMYPLNPQITQVIIYTVIVEYGIEHAAMVGMQFFSWKCVNLSFSPWRLKCSFWSPSTIFPHVVINRPGSEQVMDKFFMKSSVTTLQSEIITLGNSSIHEDELIHWHGRCLPGSFEHGAEHAGFYHYPPKFTPVGIPRGPTWSTWITVLPFAPSVKSMRFETN